MNVNLDIIALFSSNSNLLSTSEDFELFEQRFQLLEIAVPNEAKLQEYLGRINTSDSPIIYINIDNSDEDIVFSRGVDFVNFRSLMEIAMGGIESETEIFLKISVRKKVDNGRLSVYSMESIREYLLGFSTAELLGFFSDLIKLHGTIVFSSNEVETSAASSVFAFISKNDSLVPPLSLEADKRNSKLKQIKLSTHATLLSDKELIPNDFEFSPDLDSIMRDIFDRLSFTLIIFALFDLTSIDGNLLVFRLNGYKGIDGSVDVTTVPISDYIDEYRKIYHWIYEAGNINDKLGLARNIISLHLNSSNDFSYSGNMFSSVLSAYKVYEKQNIKQYIEIRNKLSDQLIDYNRRANSIVEGFASTFQKSALSVLTLFSSIIAVKVLSNTNMSGNFVTYSTILSLVILIISLIYMLISRFDTFGQKKRYETSYENFKQRYTDLLNEDDIKKILNEDKEFGEDVTFIEKKIKVYTIWWSVVLVFILGLVLTYFINEKMIEIENVMNGYPNF